MRFYIVMLAVLLLLSLLGIVPAQAATDLQDGSLFLPLIEQSAQPEQTVSPAIVGGQDADPSEWPWQVFIVIADTYMCGGSIVHPEWVVTAAHCVVDDVTAWGVSFFPAAEVLVVAGEHDLQLREGTEQLLYVAEVIVHPNYNPNTSDSDLALLRLREPVALDSAARAVPLVTSPGDDLLAAPGTLATATGWGTTSTTGPNAMILQEVSVPIITNSVCRHALGGITDNMICAGYDTGGMDTCYGDSGGPLVVPDGSGGWKLAGITSFGPYECATKYGAYTRVSRFAGWIDAQIERVEITEFTPLTGPANSQVAITGSGLDLVTGVQFGAAYAQFTVESGTTIVATVPSDAASGPIRLTTPYDVVESAQSFRLEFPLTVTVYGPGPGYVFSNIGNIHCETGEKCSESFIDGTPVQLAAQVGYDTGYTFAGWLGDCGGTAQACVVSVDAPKSVTAVFSPLTPTLTVAVMSVDGAAGQVSSQPAGINCGEACASGFTANSTVLLSAQAGPESIFSGWNGACAGAGSVCQVTMLGAQSVSAIFQPDTYNLAVALDGDGSGRVTSFPVGIDCGESCSGVFETGSTVNLSAQANTGSRFAGWSGACSGTSQTCTVNVTSAQSVTAVFRPQGVYLPAMLRHSAATQ